MTGFTYFRHNVSKLREAQEDMGHPRTHEQVALTKIPDEVDTQEVTRPVVRCSPWAMGVEEEQVQEWGERKEKEFSFGHAEFEGQIV